MPPYRGGQRSLALATMSHRLRSRCGMQKLSGQDALFLHIDRPNAGSHGTMIYIYDQESVPGQKLRFKQILGHIEQRLDSSPFFRRKIVQLPWSLGYPYWALDDQF